MVLILIFRGLLSAAAAALAAHLGGLPWSGIFGAYILGGCAGLLVSALGEPRSPA